MTPEPIQEDVTRLLRRAEEGDRVASERLFAVLYPYLRKLARCQVRSGPGWTQPTALVHEAWLRLTNGSADWRDREHFMATAAKAMRCVLVDHARRRRAVKREGPLGRVPMDEALELFESRSTDLMALDEALQRLADRDPRQARVVELRFFGAMTMEEVARTLEISSATAERSWYLARSWLRRELAG